MSIFSLNRRGGYYPPGTSLRGGWGWVAERVAYALCRFLRRGQDPALPSRFRFAMQLGDVTYRGKICGGRREPLSGRAPPALFRSHRVKLIFARICRETPPDERSLRSATSVSKGKAKRADNISPYGSGVNFPTSKQNSSSVFALRQSHLPPRGRLFGGAKAPPYRKTVRTICESGG